MAQPCGQIFFAVLFDHDNIMLRTGYPEGCKPGLMPLETFWNLFVLGRILSQRLVLFVCKMHLVTSICAKIGSLKAY